MKWNLRGAYDKMLGYVTLEADENGHYYKSHAYVANGRNTSYRTNPERSYTLDDAKKWLLEQVKDR